MLEAQNERRRRSGRREISEEDVQAEVDAHKRDQERRQAELRRERGEPDPEPD
jgi:hypothetical protein